MRTKGNDAWQAFCVFGNKNNGRFRKKLLISIFFFQFWAKEVVKVLRTCLACFCEKYFFDICFLEKWEPKTENANYIFAEMQTNWTQRVNLFLCRSIRLQLEAFFSFVLFKVMSLGNISQIQDVTIEGIITFCRQPTFPIEVYVNFDSDPLCRNVFEEIGKLASLQACISSRRCPNNFTSTSLWRTCTHYSQHCWKYRQGGKQFNHFWTIPSWDFWV